MAMKFHFNITPFGYQNAPIKFGAMQVHSAGSRHEYAIDIKTAGGWHTIRGSVPKLQPDGTRRSGHRNFLHLLSDILADVDLEILGSDYVDVQAEIRAAFPHMDGVNISDYPEE